MLGIIVFLVALVAMFAWFAYLFAKDPANLFKRNERAQRRRDFGRENGAIIAPASADQSGASATDNFKPGGGDFGGAGSSGDWGHAPGESGGDSSFGGADGGSGSD